MHTQDVVRAAIKAKRTQLEAAGWRFERRNSKGRWVRVSGQGNRQLQRAVEGAWQQSLTNS